MRGLENKSDPHDWLAELATRHASELRAYLSRFSQNPADIEDWTQEALLRVCAASMDRDLLEPRAYLFRTARNVALTRLEHRKVRSAARPELEIFTRQRHENQPMYRVAQSGQDAAMLMEAIDRLPERCREAFLLCKIHGFAYREIAEILGISVSTVEKHLVKALRLCRAILVGEDPPDGRRREPEELGEHGDVPRTGPLSRKLL